MSYKVFARKYRPGTFDKVSSQNHIVQTLKNSILADKISHAYLFSGVRGVGKTTLARLFAKAVNCADGPTVNPCDQCSSCKAIASGSSVDVVEIDGASNTGVDDVREILERVMYRPVDGRYKIFIIDEVHMLSNSAFNALLKTIEEPPAHLLFIFATTELHKIPATILSRCQNFLFKRIPFSGLYETLKSVVLSEKLVVDDDALTQIVKLADGSLRDGLSILDQVSSFADGRVGVGDIVEAFGLADPESVAKIGCSILDGNASGGLVMLSVLYDRGADIRQLSVDLLSFFRNLSVVANCPGLQDANMVPAGDLALLKKLSAKYDHIQVERLFNLFLKLSSEIKNAVSPRYSLEMTIIKGAGYTRVCSMNEIKSLVDGLENKLKECGEEPPVNKPVALKETLKKPPPIREGVAGQPRVPVSTVLSGSMGGSGVVQQEKQVPPPSVVAPVSHEKQRNRVDAGIVELKPVADTVAPRDWQAVLKLLGRHISLSAMLEEGILLEFSADTVLIGFRKNFKFAMEKVSSQGSMELIASAVLELYGKKPGVKVKYIDDKDDKVDKGCKPAASMADDKRKKKRELNEKKLTEYATDPLVKELLDNFAGSRMEIDDINKD